MNLGQRIKETREKRGMTLKQLGEKINKTESTVQRYESGKIKNPDGDVISDISHALHVNPAFLMGWTNMQSNNTVMIPLIGTIACGEPITAEQNIEEYIPTLDYDLPSGDLFYLRAKGHSMEPRIPDGSEVLCRAQPDVESGEIAAVLVNGDEEATLKRVHKLNGYVLLEAINEGYEPYIINEANPARIVGKAVSVKSEL